MTLLFAFTTASCLFVLAAIAAHIDAGSRAGDLDSDVNSRAVGLSRAVWFDNQGQLHLDPLYEDSLAQRVEAVVVLTGRPGRTPVVHVAEPMPSVAPLQAELRRRWREMVADEDTVLFTAVAADKRELRWAAAPVWEDEDIRAAILVGGDPGSSERRHELLIRWLTIGCTALVVFAAAVGHLLSGRAMRPAITSLQRQEQFLAEAAHELRTPLATLQLVVEGGSSAPERAPAALSEAVHLVDRLSRLVTGLLARARLAAGTQEVERTPLRLDQLVELTLQELPGPAAVTISTEPVVVLGDPGLLAQALRNLVENAQQHGGGGPYSPHRPVEVTVSPGRIAVRDHGSGVPPKDREKVFRRGVTGGSGTGTGLAIVRWIAQLHGGSAQLLDAPGGGLIAELRLPQYKDD
ncbi:sensor histidine kinase [Streptomyces sp. 7N604]|uniref:sensor histidine kinase n=1 Tax=Streptomyces sp. 7N604 TaxID=3457415 RepID=UPI003FD347C5